MRASARCQPNWDVSVEVDIIVTRNECL